MVERATAAAEPLPAERIAGRYELHELLGRGGMASVYRATDANSGRQVALKQLRVPERAERRAGITALFEREYHTLAQLDHPRVIAVYDFGVGSDGAPFYTMELLDGGDLRERAPLPWREACTLLFDVCSSLALLHSRRLLHRDVSPRNIRCTRDGQAKLIDFGAMVPIGAAGQLVGTPGFMAPEAVHRSALDARTDLFSLGATLYHALTAKMAYPARSFTDVLTGWQVKPPTPSALVEGVPTALDDLVMSLLSLEPSLRPQSAFEVMQRLAAIAGLTCVEPEGVSRAYLTTPGLVGRSETQAALRKRLAGVFTGPGGGVIVRGAAGLGRSRMLDACAIDAKTLGATVLRAAASGTREPFALALTLTQQLLEIAPDERADQRFPELFEQNAKETVEPLSEPAMRAACRLRPHDELVADPGRLQRSICRFMLTASRARPIVIAVDDLERVDEPTAAVLTELVDKTQRGSVLVVATVDPDAAQDARALAVLARRCDEVALAPLSAEQTRALFASVFGDVPNLELVAGEIYRIAHGNPRQSMDVAQHLVDRGAIAYAAGTWTLPGQLGTQDLPSSAEEAIRARIAELDRLGRFLIEAQALAFHDVFTDSDYRALRPEADSARIELAISELLSQQALTSDGHAYTITNRIWSEALRAGLGAEDAARRHSALVELYRGKSQMAMIHHLFAAGLDELGCDELCARHQDYAKHFDARTVLEMNAAALGPSYQRAIATACRLGRPPRVVSELRRWFVALSVSSDACYYHEAAPILRRQLEHDSGLDLWRADTQTQSAAERLGSALQRAYERYNATPEHERGYRVDEAIRVLAEFVACSIAIGAKTMDTALLEPLSALLEPFAPLSPVLEAIWQNAIATREANCACLYESACTRWTEVLAKLDAATGTEMQHVDPIRNAVAFAIGRLEATFGLASAANWATRLDQDPQQKLSALYLRKIVRIEQGDWVGAERIRRQAELLSLQSRWTQMFDSLLTIEVEAHTQARDLAGLKDVIGRIEPLAERFAGWVPYLRDAEARFHLIRGDLAAALAGFDDCVALTALDAERRSPALAAWIAAQAGRAEALFGLGRVREACDGARSALAICDEIGIDAQAHDLVRALALAEAKLGDFAAAITRIDALIERQTARGASGLRLGLSYETRAQIAIWNRDESAFERYARLTASEYRYGARCPMSVRYERLLNEAQRSGLRQAATLTDAEPTTLVASGRFGSTVVSGTVASALSGAMTTQERALRALQLLCETSAARGGHFYLVRSGEVEYVASYGFTEAPDDLCAHVRDYLARELERSETLTVVAPVSPLDEVPDSNAVADVAGVAYDLSLCACVLENVGKIAGVVAVASGERRVRSVHHSQLLAEIAAQLFLPDDDTRH